MECSGTNEQLSSGISRVESAGISIDRIISTMQILIDAIEDELPEKGDSVEIAAHFAYHFGVFRNVLDLVYINLFDANAEITEATKHLYHCLKSE